MIDIASFSADWLDQKKIQYGKDPGLMESMVHTALKETSILFSKYCKIQLILLF